MGNIADSSSIAQRTVELLKPSGERVRFTVRFGPIYQVADDFRCPVRFEGWGDSPPDIWGFDSLQALLLAVNLVNSILQSFVEGGGRVLYPDTDTDFKLERLITTDHEQE